MPLRVLLILPPHRGAEGCFWAVRFSPPPSLPPPPPLPGALGISAVLQLSAPSPSCWQGNRSRAWKAWIPQQSPRHSLDPLLEPSQGWIHQQSPKHSLDPLLDPQNQPRLCLAGAVPCCWHPDGTQVLESWKMKISDFLC